MSSAAEGLAKYLVAVIKCNDDSNAATQLVEAKLKDLLNSEIDVCINIASEKGNEWGDTAVSVNKIMRVITKSMSARKIP